MISNKTQKFILMQKYFSLLTITLAFIASAMHAQTVVPNANMESWVHTGSYDSPTGWSTPNAVSVGLGAGACVFKDSLIVNSGHYASKMVCVTSLFGNIPGAMGTGSLDVANQTFSGGFHLTDSNVAALIGYFKYSPVSVDSCLIYSILTKWNVATSQRDTVAVATFIAGTTANYTLFSQPFVMLDTTEAADTALIICSTTAHYNASQVGSTLWVDDIGFTNAVGIPEIQDVKILAYPIPADQSLEITLPQNLNAESILIFQCCGNDGESDSHIIVFDFIH